MKKIKTKRELKESLEDELLSLESEDDGDTVADVEEEEECETCGETPCVCDEEGDEEVEESEEPIVVEDDDEDEDEESEEELSLDSDEEELDIDCGCEPTGEEELDLDGEEEEEDEDEESELAKARAEEGDLEESSEGTEFYNYDTDTGEVHGSADTLDTAKAKKAGGDVVELDTSDEINGYYKIVKIHLADGKTMDPAEEGLEDRFHPTKGLSIGGSGLGLKRHEESIDYSGVKKLVEEEEGLTESFKAKAALIFESEVRSQIGQIKEQLQSEYDTKLVEETSQYRETLSEQVDSYLSYAVEQWLKENAIAIEKGLRTNIAENFMSSLKTLFQESYIEVPESKTDLYSELEKESAQLKEDLAKANHIAIHLSEKVDNLEREKILEEATQDLAKTQAAKICKLAESVEYENSEKFTEQVKTLKEFYFSNEKAKATKKETLTEKQIQKKFHVSKETIVEGATDVQSELPKSMKHYLSAITRLNKASGA